jgi:hypothetical protein
MPAPSFTASAGAAKARNPATAGARAISVPYSTLRHAQRAAALIGA